ncbi:hypothetical protein EJB06_30840 [Massilia atriviolacea]|uniref:Uncharacterized protein n=1 Tax=Massilia atriviolacea TaxID=2495579 RepID=A0A430HCD1_9BURK|nr:hypothetical protein EJB06_30840 [Massilia atriviolacea]
MAKSTAERQAEYRARRDTAAHGDGERRLNTWMSTAAHLALKRIAKRYGLTQRGMLEQLVLAEDEKIVAGLDIETPEWDRYFRIGTVRR